MTLQRNYVRVVDDNDGCSGVATSENVRSRKWGAFETSREWPLDTAQWLTRERRGKEGLVRPARRTFGKLAYERLAARQ